MKEVLALALITAVAAITTDYWIQGVIIPSSASIFSLDQDTFTFVMSVITSFLAGALVVFILMRESNKSLGKMSFFGAAGLAGLWLIATVVYIARSNRLDKSRDIVRGLSYFGLSAGSAFFQFAAGFFGS